MQTNRAGADTHRQARVGRLIAVDEQGLGWVEFDDGRGPTCARFAFAVSHEQLQQVMQLKAPVVAYEGGAGWQIVAIVGMVMATPPSPLAAGLPPATVPPAVVQADVDGQRVRVEAQQEVVIACGKASITLRANGRVIIRGTHLESDSEGTNRIKGGHVRIN